MSVMSSWAPPNRHQRSQWHRPNRARMRTRTGKCCIPDPERQVELKDKIDMRDKGGGGSSSGLNFGTVVDEDGRMP